MPDVTSLLDVFRYKPINKTPGPSLDELAIPRVVRTLGDPITSADQQRIFDPSIPKPPASIAASEEAPVKPAPANIRDSGTVAATDMQGNWGMPTAAGKK